MENQGKLLRTWTSGGLVVNMMGGSCMELSMNFASIIRILNEKEALQNFKATNNSIVVEASDKLAVIWACIKSAR